MKKSDKARNAYAQAADKLNDYCMKNFFNLTAVIMDESYPFRVQFSAIPQTSMFPDENVDENGEVGSLTVTVGLETTVKSKLKFRMSSKQLKALIRLSEKLGSIYYQAFRETADDTVNENALEEEHA